MDAETHANVCTYIDYVQGVCAEDNEEDLFVTLAEKPLIKATSVSR